MVKPSKFKAVLQGSHFLSDTMDGGNLLVVALLVNARTLNTQHTCTSRSDGLVSPL